MPYSLEIITHDVIYDVCSERTFSKEQNSELSDQRARCGDGNSDKRLTALAISLTQMQRFALITYGFCNCVRHAIYVDRIMHLSVECPFDHLASEQHSDTKYTERERERERESLFTFT